MSGRKGTTVVWNGEYFGRRAEVTTTHFDSKELGLRLVKTRWIDDADDRNGGHPAGTVVVRLIRGDGRKSDFEVLSESVEQWPT
jgi:hypothetical protein